VDDAMLPYIVAQLSTLLSSPCAHPFRRYNNIFA